MSVPELSHEQQRVLKTVYVFNYPTPLEGIRMVLDPEIDEDSVTVLLEELMKMELVEEQEAGYVVRDRVNLAQVAPFKERRSFFGFLKKSKTEEISREHRELHSRTRSYWNYVHMDTGVHDLKSNLQLYEALYKLHLLAKQLDLAQNAVKLYAQALFHHRRYTEIIEIEGWTTRLKASPPERLQFYHFLLPALAKLGRNHAMLEAARHALSIALMADNQHFVIDYRIKVAESYTILKNYENALTEYRKALALASDIGHKLGIHQGMARMFMAQNELQAAEASLAVGFDLIPPQLPVGQKKLGTTMLWDERKNIEIHTAHIVDLQSQILEKRFLYREILSLRNRFIDYTREFHQLDINSRYISNTGVWHWVVGDFDAAELLFREAVTLNEANWNARSNVGASLITAGSFDEAKEWLTQVVERADEDERGLALLNLGKLSLMINDLSTTYEHLQAASSIPHQADNLVALLKAWLAVAHLKDDKPADALSVIEESLDSREILDPAHVQNVYGIALLAQGNVDSAAEAFSRASQIADEILTATPDLYWALDGKGLALLGLAVSEKDTDKISQAIALFEKARSIVSAKGYLMELRLMFDLLQRYDSSGLLRDYEAKIVKFM